MVAARRLAVAERRVLPSTAAAIPRAVLVVADHPAADPAVDPAAAAVSTVVLVLELWPGTTVAPPMPEA